MKQLRHCVPVLGILALTVLFLKLPEIPNFLGIFKCTTCSINDPYLTLIGSGYFAMILSLSLLFPSFPSPQIAKGGVIWAVLLALVLTYLNLPSWCVSCLIAHACNILIWLIWMIAPANANETPTTPLRERTCLLLFAPISVIALFSCLNLTFMAYGFKLSKGLSEFSLQPGDSVPAFTSQTLTGNSFVLADDALKSEGMILNFITPYCPYCKEQLPILNEVAKQLEGGSYRVINVSPSLPTDLVEGSSSTEWVEDTQGKLRALFKVAGYPTLFVVGTDGKITKVIPGVPNDLKNSLLSLIKEGQKP